MSDQAGKRLLIGRDRELGELLGVLDDAAGGRGGLALVVGEPGIGKTHLVDAFADAAAARGATVLWGRAWEAGGAPAYWPWIEILRALLRDDDTADPAADTIATLLPVREPRDAAAPPALAPAEERFRMFDAIAGLLRRRAGERLLVVIIDDLHAADLPSIALLRFLARGLRQTRMVVVGAYRDSEARLTPELVQELAAVAREGRYLALARLAPGEVATWLQASGDRDAELAHTLHERTEGNPLFIVETLRLWRQQQRSGGHAARIPDGVREVIGQRLQSLPDEVRALLEVGSVLGREIDLELLASAVGMAAGEVREQLAAAVTADVIDAGGRPRFSHILLREVLYGGLPAARRAELHGAVADALLAAAAADDGPRAELVHHLFAALPLRDAVTAAGWARRAAHQALRRLGFEEAVGFFERALAVLPAERAADRCDLLLELASALITTGRGPAGQRMCVDAAELARQLGDPHRLARAALGYGEQFTFARIDPRLLALLEESLAALAPGDDPWRARLLARQAAALQPAADPQVPMAIARDAIAMSGRLGDESTRLAVLQSATSALLYFADPDERLPLNRELAELAGRRDDQLRVMRAQLRLCFDHLERGDPARADACIDAYQRIARDIGHPAYLWPAPLARSMRAIMRGQFAAAEALAAEARALADRTEDPNRAIAFTMNRAGLLRAAARHQELTEFAPEIGELLALRFDVWYRAHCMAAIHARAGALARARVALTELPAEPGDSHGRLSLVWAAEYAAAAGDADLGEQLLPMLAPIAGRNHCWGTATMVCEGPVARGLGLAAAACGRADDAARHFEDALVRVDQLDAPPYRARIEVDYAAALLRSGGAAGRERAAHLLDGARQTADRLGMPGLIAEIDALALARQAVPADARQRFDLRRDGEVWTVRCAGTEFHLKDSRGLQILARLVAEPGREHHVTDLLAPPGEQGLVEDSGAVLDAEAIGQYRERLGELRAELAEAEDWADAGRAERARAEIEALTAELARGTGLGGRARRAGATSEKARINVRRRLVDAIARIGEHSPALADHLTAAVKTGNFCSYQPAGRRGTG